MRPVRAQVVCSGNTCRSPMAQAVLRDLLDRSPVGDRTEITSAGLLVLDPGAPADPRALAALARAGLDGSAHRTTQFELDDVEEYDLVLFVEERHIDLFGAARATAGARERVRLLRAFDPVAVALGTLDLPDPVEHGPAAYHRCLKDIRSAAPRIVTELERLADERGQAGAGGEVRGV
ncbi:low molecular weight phosphotyrosine protein phosphatase [Luteipulveratus sp. YIM 133132]|uniref:protein-tyrosine-phosphatase n=1 Tax=Luteipulveratus flavus TaxID=3031728 RepID=A0ABT6CCR3_9MICO|nr:MULTISPECIES: low molecular weight phosphotyrosine protein phosphatase [unclassified Luteipulveratus]MDE9365435.1 low molecular weight phosphotyrosine protein phosphatase [Luteipulveratus sp. YIM 133132]MDF8266177.1 low molecular weight phosphotyrosine protein phosphatase [Luteipulveratus sp. YIM 133296]